MPNCSDCGFLRYHSSNINVDIQCDFNDGYVAIHPVDYCYEWMTSNFSFFALLDITAREGMLLPKPPNNPTWSVSHVVCVDQSGIQCVNGHTLCDRIN